MPRVLYANNAATSLAGPISSTATTANLASGTGALFPAIPGGSGDYFALTLNDQATGLECEICYVVGRSGDIVTLERGQEGTTARAWIAGDKAENLLTAGTTSDLAQPLDTQAQTGNFASDTSGTANVIVASLSPAPVSLASIVGTPLRIKVANTTTSSTVVLNLNGFGNQPVVLPGGALPPSGSILADGFIEIIWDGSAYQATSIAGVVIPYSVFLGTSTGSANTQVFTPSTPVAALSTNVLYSGIWGYTNNGPMTVNISGRGAVPVYRQGPAGPVPCLGGEAVVGNDSGLRYDGTRLQMVAISQGLTGVGGAKSGLVITVTSASAITISAREVQLETASGIYATAKAVSASINTGTTGAGGLDTGSLANSTAYAVYLISTGGAVAGLLSASFTAPTLPVGYSLVALVGGVMTAPSGGLVGSIQSGNRLQFVVGGANLPTVVEAASGVAGNVTTPTFVAVALSSLIPPIASEVQGLLSSNYSNDAAMLLAPNANYGGNQSTNNMPILANFDSPDGYSVPFSLALESPYLYWACSTPNGVLALTGCTFNL